MEKANSLQLMEKNILVNLYKIKNKVMVNIKFPKKLNIMENGKMENHMDKGN